MRYITIFLILLFNLIFATGPSNLHSEIVPISIDTAGSILCKYRFTKNESGGHRCMPIDYGYCIIQNDSIILYPTLTINTNDPKDAEEENQQYDIQNHWDSLFYYDTIINFDSLQQAFGYLKGFNKFNVSSFKKDTTILLPDFKKQYHIDPLKHPQKTLHNKQSANYSQEMTIKILYDFGEILLIENISHYDEKNTGVYFDYSWPWINNYGKIENLDFEMSWITGVLFLK